MFGAPVLMALLGFGMPRSFLWLAPAVAVLLTMFFDRQMQQGYGGRVVLLASLALAAPFSAIANVNFGTHPFKRNAAIPYQNILDFIRDNEPGAALVISTDPVLPYLLRTRRNGGCAGYLFGAARCLDQAATSIPSSWFPATAMFRQTPRLCVNSMISWPGLPQTAAE